MAGPIYRLRLCLDRMLEGDYDFVVKLRTKDFYQNIADRLEKLRQKLSESSSGKAITPSDLKTIKEDLKAGKNNEEVIAKIEKLLKK
jgi:hypothetical protein